MTRFDQPYIHCGMTKRQKQIFDFLVRFERANGYMPSYSEIGKEFELSSLATVHKHIHGLVKRGFVTTGPFWARSTVITKKGMRQNIVLQAEALRTVGQ